MRSGEKEGSGDRALSRDTRRTSIISAGLWPLGPHWHCNCGIGRDTFIPASCCFSLPCTFRLHIETLSRL